MIILQKVAEQSPILLTPFVNWIFKVKFMEYQTITRSNVPRSRNRTTFCFCFLPFSGMDPYQKFCFGKSSDSGGRCRQVHSEKHRRLFWCHMYSPICLILSTLCPFLTITSQIDKSSSATFFKRKGDQSILSTRKLGELFRLHRVC
jgi:hypothetical protein